MWIGVVASSPLFSIIFLVFYQSLDVNLCILKEALLVSLHACLVSIDFQGLTVMQAFLLNEKRKQNKTKQKQQNFI